MQNQAQQSELLTVEEARQTVPKSLQSAITQEFVDRINGAATDPEIARNIRENFVSYGSVLAQGNWKTEDYLNAVKYVSYKLMGMTNIESYRRTFPDRYQTMVARGDDEQTISKYVAAYNSRKIVNAIYQQTMVPTHVLNQDLFQKAINTQAHLMESANSEKVPMEAANSLMTHLKPPEIKKVELDIGIKETEEMDELREMMRSMAQRQQDLIGQGVSTREIAHQGFGQKLSGEVIEDADYVDVSPSVSGSAAPPPAQSTPPAEAPAAAPQDAPSADWPDQSSRSLLSFKPGQGGEGK